MVSRKNESSKNAGRRGRTKPGPPTSTPNEEGRTHKRGAKGTASKNLPKVGKHEAGEGGSRGGGLH
jgi:hypothetical protein